jgi:hypothetical protein
MSELEDLRESVEIWSEVSKRVVDACPRDKVTALVHVPDYIRTLLDQDKLICPLCGKSPLRARLVGGVWNFRCPDDGCGWNNNESPADTEIPDLPIG